VCFKLKISSETALQVLAEVTPRMRNVSNNVTISNTELSEEFRKEVSRNFLTANELLRHFWGSVTTKTSSGQVKALRVLKAIHNLYDR
jgi:hypothetical protein